jgi:hypothetical protein
VPSVSENILVALRTALDNGTASNVTVLRNDVLPREIPAGGLLILRDGNPGEPEVTMSPLRYHFEHAAEIEMFTEGPGRDASFDTLKAAIGTVIAANRTLGGLCDWLEPLAPAPIDLPFDGADTVKAATLTVRLHYATLDPLN